MDSKLFNLKDGLAAREYCFIEGHDFAGKKHYLKDTCARCGEPRPDAQPRCIGCNRYISRNAKWNQCADCDTREPGTY